MKNRNLVLLGTSVLTALLFAGCNIFDPLDNPTSQPQLVSAARAALDRGEIAEAKALYQQIAGSYADIAASETAFATLEENGAGMGSFMVFVGNDANGTGLAKMAERMVSGAGQARRAALYTAYQVGTSTTAITDLDLRNFVKFVSALAIAAEVLAESAPTGTVLKTNIAASGSSCTIALCAGGGGAVCNAPTTGLAAGTFAGLASTDPGSVTTANSQMLNDAVSNANTALNALSPSGNFSGSAGSFSSITGAAPDGTGTSATERCFRAQLLNFGIGT